MGSEYHVPVLLPECMEALRVRPGGAYADGTLGGCGHTREMLRLGAALVVGIDRDADAIANAGPAMAPFGERFRAVRGNYRDIAEILRPVGPVDGVLLDLGVSSHQLDKPERGFSFHDNAPLDMRMDQEQEISAYTVINGYSEDKLARILVEYGEERWAKRIAAFIVAARPVHTTAELVAAIDRAIPKAVRRGMGHPARRTFQAVRIEVNGELGDLGPALMSAAGCLKSGGRLAVISFHSLEDRIVKQTFRRCLHPCACPPGAPICTCGKTPLAALTGGPILPGEEEIRQNPRAHSAKLRFLQRV